MWKGLKKALGSSQRSSKAQKTGSAADVSQRSTSSAGALFQLDMAELDGLVTLHDKQAGQQQQAGQGAPDPQQQQQQPAAARTWAALQQQLEQQAAVQQLVSQTDDSTSKRRAAAQEKRINNAMLNPSACLYQISSLLSLSTLFEHKVGAGLGGWRGVCSQAGRAACQASDRYGSSTAAGWPAVIVCAARMEGGQRSRARVPWLAAPAGQQHAAARVAWLSGHASQPKNTRC
jgi:hypothetical protein